MVQVQMNIQLKENEFTLNLLKREDSTEEEIEIAEAFESFVEVFFTDILKQKVIKVSDG